MARGGTPNELPARMAPQNPTLWSGEGGTPFTPPRWFWGDRRGVEPWDPPRDEFWEGGSTGLGVPEVWGEVGEGVHGGNWDDYGVGRSQMWFWGPWGGDLGSPQPFQGLELAGNWGVLGCWAVFWGAGQDCGVQGGLGVPGGGGLRGRRRTTRAGSPSSRGSVWRWPRTSP